MSPDGEWQISGDPDVPIRSDEARQSLVSARGQQWKPTLPTAQWQFLGWVDDDTVWGVAGEDVPLLFSCDVRLRECEVDDATAGQRVQFSVGETNQGTLALDPEVP